MTNPYRHFSNCSSSYHTSGFETAQRCLASPWSQASILILLLNDHWFKHVSPAWWTGKLSDFAGVFFFPFLLAGGISLLTIRLRPSSRIIGSTAIALTGTGFGLLKLSSTANTLAGKTASLIFGVPVRYTLDPTDLLALSVLLGSWALWHNPPRMRFRSLGWSGIVLGALATAATSPQIPPPVFNHLAAAEGLVYAAAIYQNDLEYAAVAVSHDAGATWEQVSQLDRAQIPVQFDPPTLPVQVCAPTPAARCYRIAGAEAIEVSQDGGATWEIAWEPPPGRQDFRQRLLAGSGDTKTLVPGPHDLIIIPYQDTTYLLAAMGDEGVLRRALPAGEWERIAVLWAAPTPYAITDPVDIIGIAGWEIGIWLLAAGLILIWCSVWGLEFVQGKVNQEPHPHPKARLLWPVFAGVLLGIPSGLLLWLAILDSGTDSGWPGLLIGSGIVLFGYTTTWERITKQMPDPGPGLRAGTWIGLGAFWTGAVGIGVWFLWARGVIPYYQAAWTTALGLIIPVAGATLWKSRIVFLQAIPSNKTPKKNPGPTPPAPTL